jgi:hypothetical protein
LSPLLWLELVFKHHLSIESGVALASSCCFFWNNERIQEWIKEKENQVFGTNIPKPFWNKLQATSYLMLIDMKYLFETRFSMIRDCTSSGIRVPIPFLGVFSSKERLWEAFSKFVNIDILKYHLSKNRQHTISFHTNYFNVTLTKEYPFLYEYITVCNFIREDFKSILKYEGL